MAAAMEGLPWQQSTCDRYIVYEKVENALIQYYQQVSNVTLATDNMKT